MVQGDGEPCVTDAYQVLAKLADAAGLGAQWLAKCESDRRAYQMIEYDAVTTACVLLMKSSVAMRFAGYRI